MSRSSPLRPAARWYAGAGVALAVFGVGPRQPARATAPSPAPAAVVFDAHAPRSPVRHFIYLMQGGRTFDNYFMGYPGAEGPPAGTCMPVSLHRRQGACVSPFLLNPAVRSSLGASARIVSSQLDGGRMDGFVAAYDSRGEDGSLVMGHLGEEQLSYYWNTARSYELFDRFFSSTTSGIAANRLYWLTGRLAPRGGGSLPTIFDSLERAGVSWKLYVQGYHPADGRLSRTGRANQATLAPVLDFARFTHDRALARHIVGLSSYYKDMADGHLPSVAYIVSSDSDNERSGASVVHGERLVDSLLTALMESRQWWHSAFFWSYDTSGGWFDHVRPPRLAGSQLGLRVPAILVSPYAPDGRVNHQLFDPSSALRFIEWNWWLGPLARSDATAPNLATAFDFAARPRPPVLIAGGTALRSSLPPPARLPRPDVALVYLLYLLAVGAALGLVALASVVSRSSSVATRHKRAGEPTGGGGRR